VARWRNPQSGAIPDRRGLYDCNQAGQQALRTGFAQYRCNPAYAPDGAIVYYQLWIEYP
jgi:hypothetical protein